MNQRILALLTITLFLSIPLLPQESSTILTNIHIREPCKLDDFNLSEALLKINETTLEQHIRYIQGVGPHPTGSEALNELTTYLYDELTSYNLTVELHPWRYQLRKGLNIEATLPGHGITDGIIIVCAHYDSVFISPGADDDGSGVAAILAMAEQLQGKTFNSTIRFILFSGEEQGLLGSHEYAKEARKQGDNILAAIALDGVGYAPSAEYGAYIRNYANQDSDWIVDMTTNISESYPLLINLSIQRFPNQPISDHQSFLENGYQTSYFLEPIINPFYHTSQDIIDHMNLSYLVKVTRLVLGTITTMATLNRIIDPTNLHIRILGSVFAYPALFKVQIENTRHHIDTANVTVHIEITHRKTNEYLPGPYNTTSNWVFTTEITDEFTFIVASHRYPRAPIQFTITLNGYNDDLGIYLQRQTKGLSLKSMLIIRPRF